MIDVFALFLDFFFDENIASIFCAILIPFQPDFSICRGRNSTDFPFSCIVLRTMCLSQIQINVVIWLYLCHFLNIFVSGIKILGSWGNNKNWLELNSLKLNHHISKLKLPKSVKHIVQTGFYEHLTIFLSVYAYGKSVL